MTGIRRGREGEACLAPPGAARAPLEICSLCWIRAIAAINPLSYAVDAARAIFNDQLGDPSVIWGVAIMAILAVAALVVAARAFGNAAA